MKKKCKKVRYETRGQAYTKRQGKQIIIGYFTTKEEAYKAKQSFPQYT